MTGACRFCGSSSEAVKRLITSCPKLAQIIYKYRHHLVAGVSHHELAKQLHLEESAVRIMKMSRGSSGKRKLQTRWDYTLLTDITVPFNRSDMTMVDRTNKEATFIDVEIPLTHILQAAVTKKQHKYRVLAFEIKQHGS
jgi:hypothetical protein